MGRRVSTSSRCFWGLSAAGAAAAAAAGSSEKATRLPRSKEPLGDAATRAAFNLFNMGLTALTLALAMSRARLPGLLTTEASAGCDAEKGL